MHAADVVLSRHNDHEDGPSTSIMDLISISVVHDRVTNFDKEESAKKRVINGTLK